MPGKMKGYNVGIPFNRPMQRSAAALTNYKWKLPVRHDIIIHKAAMHRIRFFTAVVNDKQGMNHRSTMGRTEL